MNATARLKDLLAKTGTAALIISLRVLDDEAKTAPTQETLLVRAWTIDELERRFPAASAAVEAAYLEDDERIERGEDSIDVDTVAILLPAIGL